MVSQVAPHPEELPLYWEEVVNEALLCAIAHTEKETWEVTERDRGLFPESWLSWTFELNWMRELARC